MQITCKLINFTCNAWKIDSEKHDVKKWIIRKSYESFHGGKFHLPWLLKQKRTNKLKYKYYVINELIAYMKWKKIVYFISVNACKEHTWSHAKIHMRWWDDDKRGEKTPEKNYSLVKLFYRFFVSVSITTKKEKHTQTVWTIFIEIISRFLLVILAFTFVFQFLVNFICFHLNHFMRRFFRPKRFTQRRCKLAA